MIVITADSITVLRDIVMRLESDPGIADTLESIAIAISGREILKLLPSAGPARRDVKKL
jgi:hypothetical protein